MLANENDATRVRNLFRGSGVKLAWLGIVAKPNGHQIFLNGLDATAAHFAPDFMVGNGNLPKSYENAINNCTKRINVINCATWLSRAKCWINPIKALPTAIADYKEYQQFIRYQAYSNPDIAFDPICFKNVKATFFPDPQPVFDLQHPYMGNVMNMIFGSDTGFPDMWLAVPSKQVGVLCQRPFV
ncbi:unnamed protein product, partial [Mesorhabditis belari]|uniref:Uncharacterized protein n=1 Tax=Mesorhabditis belari TaxID=2138241 RepID=A0AAF3ELQ5_9BILA